MPRHRILLACGGVLIAAALSITPSASAAPGLEVALQDDFVFVQQSWYSREQALANARSLGVTRLRVTVQWAGVLADPAGRRAPAARVYNWSAYDTLIADSARYGIKVQMTLTGHAPAWATADHRIGNREPSPVAFAQFAADTAAHFAGRVDRYSIWNEPNWHSQLKPSANCRPGHWGAGCDAKLGNAYRTLYQRAYTAIAGADPAARVLIGEFAPQSKGNAASAPLAVLRAITCSTRTWTAARRCTTLRADGFAQHPYAFKVQPSSPRGTGRDDVTMATLGRLTSALDKLARRRALVTRSGAKMELYLTEHGYFQAGSRRIPQAKRAAYLRQSFDMALRNPRVRQLLQYLLVSPVGAADTFPTQLMSTAGQPTPAFTGLAEWAARNATPDRAGVAGAVVLEGWRCAPAVQRSVKRA